MRGLNENRQKGLYTGGKVIFGYRAKDQRIEIYEPEAEIIRQIFDKLVADTSMKEIIEELNENGIIIEANLSPEAQFIVLLQMKNMLVYIGTMTKYLKISIRPLYLRQFFIL